MTRNFSNKCKQNYQSFLNMGTSLFFSITYKILYVEEVRLMIEYVSQNQKARFVKTDSLENTFFGTKINSFSSINKTICFLEKTNAVLE
jgi:hypothetical protein